ncbi:MAG: nicotinate phosphoribosyltransferase [Actinomycetota bacterium]
MTWVTDDNQALLTDLYELTMAASYHRAGMNEPATFDLFVRDLPDNRNFLVSCGLEHALDYLGSVRFTQDSLDYLDSLEMFGDDFLSYLSDFSFSGEVDAIAEGEIVFACEPLLQVTAPLIEAQIVETFLLNCVMFQTMIASKAARVALACGNRSFVDFSPRRDHGADAAVKAARASYVGGASATSNVLAGKLFGIDTSGTMAHSYVLAFEDEISAFREFVRDFPERSVLLIDTFDVEEGARNAVTVGREMAAESGKLRAVRIDSGDLDSLSRSVRKILDEGGLQGTGIFVSGDLNEHKIKSLLDESVPVDAFGVGTEMGTSTDAPALGSAYKLVQDARGPKMKLSTGKATLPGRKQVFRFTTGGRFERDVIALRGEEIGSGVALLQRVMAGGRRTAPPEPLARLRERCASATSKLPEPLRALERADEPYAVELSPELERLVAEMEQRGG